MTTIEKITKKKLTSHESVPLDYYHNLTIEEALEEKETLLKQKYNLQQVREERKTYGSRSNYLKGPKTVGECDAEITHVNQQLEAINRQIKILEPQPTRAKKALHPVLPRELVISFLSEREFLELLEDEFKRMHQMMLERSSLVRKSNKEPTDADEILKLSKDVNHLALEIIKQLSEFEEAENLSTSQAEKLILKVLKCQRNAGIKDPLEITAARAEALGIDRS